MLNKERERKKNSAETSFRSWFRLIYIGKHRKGTNCRLDTRLVPGNIFKGKRETMRKSTDARFVL